jgi:CheY-like chemotaxis protein
MKLNALLMCRNQHSIRLISTVLSGINVTEEVCDTAAAATDSLLQRPYSAVVLDFDLPGAIQVASMVRSLTPDRKPILFAMIGALTPVGGAVQAGANFVLYKPLEVEQVTHSFRAAHAFMKADRRRATRHKLSGLAYLDLGNESVPALMVDLSEQGVSLQAAEALPAAEEVRLRFLLPNTEIMIEAVGDVIWSEADGRAAMFFTRITPSSRKHLSIWLSKHGAKKSDAVRVLLPPHKARHTPRATH